MQQECQHCIESIQSGSQKTTLSYEVWQLVVTGEEPPIHISPKSDMVQHEHKDQRQDWDALFSHASLSQ